MIEPRSDPYVTAHVCLHMKAHCSKADLLPRCNYSQRLRTDYHSPASTLDDAANCNHRRPQRDQAG